MTQTVPTDALLHGASFTPETTTLEIKADAFEIKSAREPMYAETDTTRIQPLREPTGEEVFQIVSMKEIGQEFLDLLDTLPLNRELALAKTKVEEAVMWAVKGVTK